MKTNRTFRKIASAATAAILASCAMMPMAVTNVEAAGGSITITNDQKNHTYGAYQIFKGTISTNAANKKVLSNVNWSDAITNKTGIQNAVQGITLSDTTKPKPFESCDTAAKIAEKLATYNDDSEVAIKFAAAVAPYLTTPAGTSVETQTPYQINVPEDGYYLVKDTNTSINADDISYTRYIVEVLGNKPTIEAKSKLPDFEKYVKDINDSTSTDYTDWQEYADHDYDDDVPFKLEATVADDFGSYTAYKLKFHDTLAEGLSFNDDVKVYVGDSTTAINDSYYTVNTNPGGDDTFTVELSNLKNVTGVQAGSKIRVEYTAGLDGSSDYSKVVLGKDGNPNTAYLEYSNDPNDTNGNTTGRTPKETVIVYTYQTIVNKTDGTTGLTGATFTLEKQLENGTWKTINQMETGETATFTFKGLDDGNYRLTETNAPTGYNMLPAPIYFEVSATHNAGLTALNGTEKSLTFGDLDVGVDPLEFELGETSTYNEYSTLLLEVKNKAGSVLPSTGGIGTTPFYIGGGVLVAAAGVYIIVRKRIKHSKDDEK